MKWSDDVTMVVVRITVYGPVLMGRERCAGLFAFIAVAASLTFVGLILIDPNGIFGTEPTPWVTPGVCVTRERAGLRLGTARFLEALPP
jgi:hypothetical protein